MKLEEMKALSQEQLLDNVEDWKKKLVQLRIEASIQKKAEKPHKFRELKTQIARALTLYRLKEMEGS